jgi:cobalt/nickel transport system permease protein
VSALGANILNMGVLSSLVAYAVYRGLGWAGGWLGRPPVAAALASWIAVVAAAALCSLELVASGRAAAVVIFPAMLGIHALIGVGEAALTVGALAVVTAARPDFLPVRASAEVTP